MKSKIFWVLGIVLTFYAAEIPLEAGYTFKNGRFVSTWEVATMPVDWHYEQGLAAVQACDWEIAAQQFSVVTINFPTTSYGQEGLFWLGVSYYYLEELDFANEAFSSYLEVKNNPRFFQQSVEYKFSIAELFASGVKRRFFGTKQLPKWASGQSMALEIYDEVIAAVPCSEIAAQALVSKGYLLWCNRDYRCAIEAFQQVIRRFPKNELAPECYLLISKVYLQQSQYEYQNPDILAFAQINLRKFTRDFPREERVCQVEEDVMAIKEIYANGLYNMGQFYERTRKPRAAIIYYKNAIHQFPDTCIADLCRERLECLDPCHLVITPGLGQPDNDDSQDYKEFNIEGREPEWHPVLLD